MKSCKIAVLVASAALCLAGFTAHAETRIMPFGDSVTSSQGGHNSYRYWLYQLLVDKGYNFDFVGTQQGVGSGEAPPDPAWTDTQHEGYPGATSRNARDSAFALASANDPDIVLMDFGANDPIAGIPPDETQSNLQLAVESLRAVNPDMIIVMAIPTPSFDDDKFAAKLMRQAVSRAAKAERKLGARVFVVNLASGFSPSRHTYDGSHPNDLGEIKIAKKYFSVVRRFAER